MIIPNLALSRPWAVVVSVVGIILFGAASYVSLPRESSPDITIPYVFITTRYEGVAPEDMETLITMPLERKLKALKGVEEMKSTSEEGLSFISIKFLPSENIDDALQKVRDKVDQAKPDLPTDLEDDPEVEEANFSDQPILQIALSGEFSAKRLKRMAEDLQDRIESIPGVLEAPIIGGLTREIHVELDLDRVGFYHLPVSSILNSVSQSNVNMPGGSLDIGEGKYQVRVPEEFSNPAEINSLVAYVRDGKPIYVRDVAEIKDSNKDPATVSRIQGQPSVTVQVKKRAGENIIFITDEVKRVVEEMRPQLPPSLRIDLMADQSKDIRRMVSDLENNIITGLILVLGVVLVGIGGRSAVFVSIAIPLSMLVSFIVLDMMGITLNMVVLFSLILALGMLVDNGIVMVENIYRYMQLGHSRFEAARLGAGEVAWPVITSTLTTVAAFFPMLYWPGIMGEFMSYLPLTCIIALSASLFVALVVNPVLSAKFQTVPRGVAADGEIPPGWIQRRYRGLLEWSLRHRGLVVVLCIASLFGSIVAFGAFGRGVEFFPDIEPNRAIIEIKAPVGTNLATSDRLVRIAEQVALTYPDILFVISQAGMEGGDPFSSGGTGEHLSQITLEFKEMKERSRPSSAIVSELREILKEKIKGAEVRVEKQEEGPPTGSPVTLELLSDNLQDLDAMAQTLHKLLEATPGLVNVKDNVLRGKPELAVHVDKEKAALLGLDAYTIAYTVKTAFNGAKVGVYREEDEEYDIVAKLPKKDRSSVEAVRRLTVAGPNGEPIPLTSVASVELSSGLGGVHRKDQKRVATLEADVSGRLANDAIAELTARLNTMSWPRGMTWRFAGEQEEQQKAQAFLTKAFGAAVLLILLVLLAQFNSLGVPFIILTSVALSLIGVFLGLLVTNTAFGVIMTGVGVVSLAGVVVNNAIVLIDYFNVLREQGLEVHEALIRTGMTRFRPVLLTAVTTMLGLLPMAAGVSYDFLNLQWDIGGESAQWWGPMAVAVLFGLLVATFLTLVLVPVLLSIGESVGTWRTRRREKAAGRTRDRQEKAVPSP
ncbi:efflux RND transporter permease subunit [Megalodesulfovibrio paquesii]